MQSLQMAISKLWNRFVSIWNNRYFGMFWNIAVLKLVHNLLAEP